MKYLGSNVDQDERCILFSQEDYIKDLKPIEIELTKDKNRELSVKEQHDYRALVDN